MAESIKGSSQLWQPLDSFPCLSHHPSNNTKHKDSKGRAFWHCDCPTENSTGRHLEAFPILQWCLLNQRESLTQPSLVCPQCQIPQWHFTQIPPLEGFSLPLLSTAVGIFCNGLHKQFLWSKQGEVYSKSPRNVYNRFWDFKQKDTVTKPILPRTKWYKQLSF